MHTLCLGRFAYAQDPDLQPTPHIASQGRHHDHAKPHTSAPDGCRNILIERLVDNQSTRHIVLVWGKSGPFTYSGLAR